MFKSKRKGPAKGFLLGGPAYQNLVDSRHAGAMGSLAVRLNSLGYRTGFLYTHACPVELARNEMMRTALATDYTWLVSADADCYWPVEQQDALIWIATELARLDAPFAAVPVEQRNGISNVVAEGAPWQPGFERLKSIPMEQAMHPCKAIGTGLCVFRLKWYREHWPEAPWFRTDWRSGLMVGEDFWHCLTLGGRATPYYAPVLRVTHAHRGTAK